MLKKAVSRGVSLIELMIVIAVIGILAGGSVYVVKNVSTSAQISDAVGRMDQLESAARTFYMTYGCLPGDCASNTIGFSSLQSYSSMLFGNFDNIVNSWYSVSTAPTGTNASFEDANAIAQLALSGMLGVAPSSLTAFSTTEYITDGTTNGRIGLPYFVASTSAITSNPLYNYYNNYYIRGKSASVFFGIKSVPSNLVTVNGLPNVSNRTIGGGASVNFILAAYATYANSGTTLTSPVLDAQSYTIMTGIETKSDGDNPLTGSTQIVLLGLYRPYASAGNDVYIPIARSATVAAASVTTPTNSTTVPVLTGIVNYTATGTTGAIYSNISSISSASYSTIFNQSAIGTATAGVISTTNVVASMEVVRLIYGLNASTF